MVKPKRSRQVLQIVFKTPCMFENVFVAFFRSRMHVSTSMESLFEGLSEIDLAPTYKDRN